MTPESENDAETGQEAASTPSGGRTTREVRELADSLRNRVDLFGKTLAAVATLGTTAVGLTKIGDLFPAEGWNVLWVIVACVGLTAAALSAIGVAARLMRVSRPIFMDDDLERNQDLDRGEKDEVKPVFDATARRFGYTSLLGLRGRERSLREAASQTIDKDEQARRTALAEDVKSEIEQAFARGQVVVIRRRATKAVTDKLAWVLYLVVIAGLVFFAVGTDKVSSARADSIAKAKACGDARKATATPGELQRTNFCDGTAGASAEEQKKPPSAAEARAQVIVKLASALEACTALVGDANGGALKDADCDPVRKAIMTLTR